MKLRTDTNRYHRLSVALVLVNVLVILYLVVGYLSKAWNGVFGGKAVSFADVLALFLMFAILGLLVCSLFYNATVAKGRVVIKALFPVASLSVGDILYYSDLGRLSPIDVVGIANGLGKSTVRYLLRTRNVTALKAELKVLNQSIRFSDRDARLIEEYLNHGRH